MINKIVNYLQSRSNKTKGRILAGTILVTAVGFGTLWLNNVRENFSNISTSDLNLQNLAPGQVLGKDTNFVTIESMESRNGKRYLYFKVENTTDDIINFPDKSKISLTVEGRVLEPEAIQTRQHQPFVMKVLSKTTNYGMLIFPEFEGDEGSLVIRELNLEQKNEFSKQTIEINFEKLKPLEELRS